MSQQNIPIKRLNAFDPLREREFYVYTAPINNFLIGTERSVTVEIQGDSDFELVKISASWLQSLSQPLSLTAVIGGYWPVRMTNIGSGESFFDEFDFQSINGPGKVPFILPDPQAIAARSIIEITMTNNFAFDMPFFAFALIGAKVYQ